MGMIGEIFQPCTAWGSSVIDEIVPILDECCPALIDAMREGKAHVVAGWEGHLVDSATDLSVAERIAHIAVGILLLIPLVNVVVSAFLEDAFPVSSAVASAVIDDAFFTRDIDLLPPTAEECARRKREALELLRGDLYVRANADGQAYQEALGQYHRDFRRWEQAVQNGNWAPAPQKPEWLDLPWHARGLREYNLNRILAPYATTYAPSALRAFKDLLPEAKKEQLSRCLDRSYNANPQTRVARESMSKLYDFLRQRWAEYQGTDKEQEFKGYIAGVLLQVIDAHQNCIDQVNSQLESLLINVVAGWEAERSGNGSIARRLQNRASYEDFRYCLNLIKQACVVEYPTEIHMADLERYVKNALAIRHGFSNDLTRTGAIVSFELDKVVRIEQVVFGQMEGDDPRLQERREACRYAPLKHFIEELRVPNGDMRVLRNQILVWAQKYYGLEADDPLTQEFVAEISADPAFTADEGGDLTYGAILCFLSQLGILLPGREEPRRAVEVLLGRLGLH